MRTYHQLTPGERYELSALRKQGLRPTEIALALGRYRSTIYREIERNSRKDGAYRTCHCGPKDSGSALTLSTQSTLQRRRLRTR
ncbi:MAG TPA: hypothetical protein EYQ64_15725 [Gemmatimonadetes bacterium]|nr:hypothetical protein [Gemmatimonadota bacterium]